MQQPFSNNLVEVLIKPNNMRTAIEIRHIALWFKENILAFKDVSIEILMKLVAECKAEFKYPHDIIIREGDIGDCMYILLSGRVSVHYRGDQSAVTNEEMHELMNVKSNSFIPVKQNVSDIINQELGPQVGQLEAGSVFGEVALIEDCLRTASILALPNTNEVNRHESSFNQQQQQQQSSSSSPLTKQSEKQSVCLVNISRTLYNNTVRVAMENEFHERMKFVKNIIYFQHLSDKIQKQIAMSLEKQKYEYNQVVLKQGSSFNGLYFVYRGELRVTLHVKQSQTSTTYRNNYRSIKYDLPLITGSNPNTPEKTVDQNLLNIDYLPLNSINQFIEILQSNLPYFYKLNAGRLLQQLDNYKLQIKIDNFIKKLNELKLNQLNENNTQLNYYTITSEQTHELEKSSLMTHKRRLPPSFVGMCNWFPNM
ncbi:unnamed protein product [Schistosoma mattheei]|uniref:Cyclic nucleotide-binding domain-containing protein n=1 Tax=Schistosoma mattheei TaxID=31246 RepID=A0AA85BLV7_9TREM|nr:unnamed protein product [Schistosoma mattheei]